MTRPLHRESTTCVSRKGSCLPQNIARTSKPAHGTADRPTKATTSKAQLDL